MDEGVSELLQEALPPSPSGLLRPPNLGKTPRKLFSEKRDGPAMGAHLCVLICPWRWTRPPLLDMSQDCPSGWGRCSLGLFPEDGRAYLPCWCEGSSAGGQVIITFIHDGFWRNVIRHDVITRTGNPNNALRY